MYAYHLYQIMSNFFSHIKLFLSTNAQLFYKIHINCMTVHIAASFTLKKKISAYTIDASQANITSSRKRTCCSSVW